MKRWKWFVLLAVILLSGCRGGQDSGDGPVDVSMLPAGQTLFLNNCVACHRGSGNPPEPNAVILDSRALNTEKTFNALVRQPNAAGMPPFGKDQLSDADIHEIYEYLKSSRTSQAH